MQCQLYSRNVPRLTEHHLVQKLVPKQHTKRKKLDPGETIDICPACHRQIHVLFDNRQLAQELNTLDRLQTHPNMVKFLVKFLGWVRQQDPDRRVKVRR